MHRLSQAQCCGSAGHSHFISVCRCDSWEGSIPDNIWPNARLLSEDFCLGSTPHTLKTTQQRCVLVIQEVHLKLSRFIQPITKKTQQGCRPWYNSENVPYRMSSDDRLRAPAYADRRNRAASPWSGETAAASGVALAMTSSRCRAHRRTRMSCIRQQAAYPQYKSGGIVPAAPRLDICS